MLINSKLVYISISLIITVFIICIAALSFSINTNIVQKKYLIIETENKVTKRFDIVYKDQFASGNDSLKEDNIMNTGIPDSVIIKLEDNSSALFFNRNPKFLIWCLLISLMEAVSVGFLPIYIMLIYRIFRSYKIKRSYMFNIIISVILVGIVMIGGARISDQKLMSAPDIVEYFNILIDRRVSIQIAVLIPQISAIFGIMALLMVPCATDRLKEDIPDIDMIKETAERFETLNSYTNFCLLSLSVIIVLTVLTTGAMRESILDVINVTGLDIMPREFVYAYGLFFTVLLAIIYIPVQHYIKFKGSEILEGLNELNDENIKNKKALESAKEKFDLKTTPAGTLSASLTVLAPFISSLLPGYLNF